MAIDMKAVAAPASKADGHLDRPRPQGSRTPLLRRLPKSEARASSGGSRWKESGQSPCGPSRLDGRDAVRGTDDTPAGSAGSRDHRRQVICKRLRESRKTAFGEDAAERATSWQGGSSRARTPDRAGRPESWRRCCPPAEKVPGERYVHGERVSCYVT